MRKKSQAREKGTSQAEKRTSTSYFSSRINGSYSARFIIALGLGARAAHGSGSSSDARIDFAMLMGLLFLLALGAGPWSLDALLSGDAHDRP